MPEGVRAPLPIELKPAGAKRKIKTMESPHLDIKSKCFVNAKAILRQAAHQNPHKKEEATLREPKEIIDEMKELDRQSAEILKTIKELI